MWSLVRFSGAASMVALMVSYSVLGVQVRRPISKMDARKPRCRASVHRKRRLLPSPSPSCTARVGRPAKAAAALTPRAPAPPPPMLSPLSPQAAPLLLLAASLPLPLARTAAPRPGRCWRALAAGARVGAPALPVRGWLVHPALPATRPRGGLPAPLRPRLPLPLAPPLPALLLLLRGVGRARALHLLLAAARPLARRARARAPARAPTRAPAAIVPPRVLHEPRRVPKPPHVLKGVRVRRAPGRPRAAAAVLVGGGQGVRRQVLHASGRARGAHLERVVDGKQVIPLAHSAGCRKTKRARALREANPRAGAVHARKKSPHAGDWAQRKGNVERKSWVGAPSRGRRSSVRRVQEESEWQVMSSLRLALVHPFWQCATRLRVYGCALGVVG